MGNTPEKYLSQIKPVDLKGKVALVTGANTGIGYITCREIAKMGAHVFMACRSKERAEEAIQKLKAEIPGANLNVEFIPLDLNSLASVQQCAEEFKQKKLPLHILVNNAGVMALPNLEHTVDGIEKQFGINHVGHFQLTQLLLPVIKSSASTEFPARIVNLSSMAHTRGTINWDDLFFKNGGYSAFGAYSQSKLANVLFTVELQRRLDEEKANVTTYAVHPGWVQTELTRNMSYSGLIDTVANVVAKTPEDGALTSIKVATDPLVVGKEFAGKYWADCAIKEPAKQATSIDDAKKLWNVTEQLIKDHSKIKQDL